MTNLRPVAERLEARRVRFAVPHAKRTDAIDWSYHCLSNYPTVTLVCLLTAVGGLASLAVFALKLVKSL
jgi:hypothetical protein